MCGRCQLLPCTGGQRGSQLMAQRFELRAVQRWRSTAGRTIGCAPRARRLCHGLLCGDLALRKRACTVRPLYRRFHHVVHGDRRTDASRRGDRRSKDRVLDRGVGTLVILLYRRQPLVGANTGLRSGAVISRCRSLRQRCCRVYSEESERLRTDRQSTRRAASCSWLTQELI